jgi:tricorn protease
MPVAGGAPQRRTWDGDAVPEGWSPDGRMVVRTLRYSTLPDPKLVLLDGQGKREMVPLAGAAEAVYSTDGHTLFFTRWDRQSSSTKRYQGGTAESIWRVDGRNERVFDGQRGQGHQGREPPGRLRC